METQGGLIRGRRDPCPASPNHRSALLTGRKLPFTGQGMVLYSVAAAGPRRPCAGLFPHGPWRLGHRALEMRGRRCFLTQNLAGRVSRFLSSSRVSCRILGGLSCRNVPQNHSHRADAGDGGKPEGSCHPSVFPGEGCLPRLCDSLSPGQEGKAAELFADHRINSGRAETRGCKSNWLSKVTICEGLPWWSSG